VGGGGLSGGGGGKGRVMTQSLYAHMNKRKKMIDFLWYWGLN
jgi:hypothetical protein